MKGPSEQPHLCLKSADVDPDDSERVLIVDSHRVRVRPQRRRGRNYEYHYDWLTGPNAGYGFGTSGPSRQDDRDHQLQISAFLAGIDPATGYLRDD